MSQVLAPCRSLLGTSTSCRLHQAPFRASLHSFRNSNNTLQRLQHAQQPRAAAGGKGCVVSAASAGVTPSSARSAKEAVEEGLELFSMGDAARALALFQRALELQPSEDEARAALYNAACAHTKLSQWQPAVDAVVKAVNDYELRLTVALKDPDLAPLRERREWVSALSQVRGLSCGCAAAAAAGACTSTVITFPANVATVDIAVHDDDPFTAPPAIYAPLLTYPPWHANVQMRGGIGEASYSQLRAEAKAPFRLTRIVFLGGLAAGAGLGLLIILARLAAALKGGGPSGALCTAASAWPLPYPALSCLCALQRASQAPSRSPLPTPFASPSRQAAKARQSWARRCRTWASMPQRW